jgi:hypothetical protein
VTLARGAPIGEAVNFTAEVIGAIPPEAIGRMMYDVEEAELIRRLVHGRGRRWP